MGYEHLIEILKIPQGQPINQKKTKKYKIRKTIVKRHRFKDIEIKIKLMPGHPPIKQKTRPIPHNLQSCVVKERVKLLQFGHLEEIQKVEEDCFVSLVVLNMNKDKSVHWIQ